MRLHVIQHVPFEGAALIGEWAAEQDWEITSGLALTEEFPPCDEVDLLCVMGGPMAADDEIASPWLRAEKHYIAECVAQGCAVLGVCLGAQIIAEVLGGRVRRNQHREIGWFPVEKTEIGATERLFAAWPDSFAAGHWHGDTFDLPLGIEPLLSSEATLNQAFVFDHRVVGLQFHIEWTHASLGALVEVCADELEDASTWVMPADEIMAEAPARIETNRELLFAFLDALAEEAASFSAEIVS